MFRSKAKPRDFKKGIDADDTRRRRVDVTVELRKKSRDEQVMKRRMKAAAEGANNENNQNTSNVNIADISAASSVLTLKDIQEKLKNLPQLVQAVLSPDPAQHIPAVTEFRKLLSIEKNPPIQQVIDTNLVPRFIEMLSSTNETLQFEAAWTLTNIASGTTQHTQHIINHGAIPQFVALLASPNADVREQAVWALGNIAGDSPLFRDSVIAAGGVPSMLSVFKNDAKLSMIRNATWTVSNLCRGKPQPRFEQIKAVLPTLTTLISMEDVEVITDACWALSYISDDNGVGNQKIQAVVEAGVCPQLVSFLNHHNSSVQVPALRCIGNIVTGDDMQTQAVLQCNPLPYLLGLMSHRKKGIRKEACWTVSNITAGNSHQIQQVLDANLIPPLITLVREAEFEIQKEAAWAVSNATSGGTDQQIHFLVRQGAIPAMCNLLSSADPKMVMVAMEGVENILKAGKKEAVRASCVNQYCEFVEECGGLDQLENLQRHENEEIYDKAVKLLREFFESEEEDDGAMVPAVDESKNQFNFGMAAHTPAGGFSF